MDRFQVVQNAAAKLLIKSSTWSHVSPLLISLHWLPIKFRVQYQGLLVIPHSRLKTKGGRAFEVVAQTLWNSLPSSLRSVNSADSFKKQLKTHLFKIAFG
ncbi:hypothetical protein LDENG_00018050 [Lucifuga dentata]|nr:hypothetical protein LDENG_00018050 [Lucifuga dentata]